MNEKARTFLRAMNCNEIEKLLSVGVINVNEVRRAHDLEPIPGGDVNMVCVNGDVVPLVELSRLFEPSA